MDVPAHHHPPEQRPEWNPCAEQQGASAGQQADPKRQSSTEQQRSGQREHHREVPESSIEPTSGRMPGVAVGLKRHGAGAISLNQCRYPYRTSGYGKMTSAQLNIETALAACRGDSALARALIAQYRRFTRRTGETGRRVGGRASGLGGRPRARASPAIGRRLFGRRADCVGGARVGNRYSRAKFHGDLDGGVAVVGARIRRVFGRSH